MARGVGRSRPAPAALFKRLSMDLCVCVSGIVALLEFAGIKLDPLRIHEKNAAKVGPEYLRKGGVLINNGGECRAPVPRPPLTSSIDRSIDGWI